jgi:serine protease inhibitor
MLLGRIKVAHLPVVEIGEEGVAVAAASAEMIAAEEAKDQVAIAVVIAVGEENNLLTI